MAEDEDSILGKLRKLGNRIRRGIDKKHPPKQQHFDAVRSAVTEQWNQQQFQGKARLTQDQKEKVQRSEQEKRQKELEKQSSKKQSKDHGHSH